MPPYSFWFSPLNSVLGEMVTEWENSRTVEVREDEPSHSARHWASPNTVSPPNLTDVTG